MQFLAPLALITTLLTPSTLASIGNYKWLIFNYKCQCGEPTRGPQGNCVYTFNATAPQYTTPDNVCIGALSASCHSTTGKEILRYCDILEWTPCGEDDAALPRLWTFDRYTSRDKTFNINVRMEDELTCDDKANTYEVVGKFNDTGNGMTSKFNVKVKTYSS